ncbi:MAG TPA: 50S ribosomal protein L25 [Candidatus Acidoferrales bacterium]|nr:50S ribosomal protein L25 [Candidatus Acidoferrales bacterium]
MTSMMIEAIRRNERGKNAARRLRREGRVPAVLYGGGSEPVALAVETRQAEQVLRAAGHNPIFELKVEGKDQTHAMLKGWQVDPVRGNVLHLDLQRVAMDVRVRVRVRVHTTGEPQGVKVQGGIFERVTREIEVECLPGDIPEEVTADVSEMTIHQQLRAGDLALDTTKIRLLTDPQRVLAHVVAPAKEEEVAAPEAAAVAPVEAAAPAEPEVIKKGKKEEEAEEEAGEEGEGKGKGKGKGE